MTRNYIVSYDLNGRTPTHAEMDRHIRAFATEYGRILETVWYIRTGYTLEQVYNYMNSKLSLDDPCLQHKLDTTDAPYFVFQHQEAELLQNQRLVEAGKRPAQRKKLSELLADVERLIVLRDNLYSFANEALRKSAPRRRRSGGAQP